MFWQHQKMGFEFPKYIVRNLITPITFRRGAMPRPLYCLWIKREELLLVYSLFKHRDVFPPNLRKCLQSIPDQMQMHHRGLLWENDIRRRDNDNCHRRGPGTPSHHSAGIVDIAMEDMNIQITMRTMGQMTHGGRGLSVTGLVIMIMVCTRGHSPHPATC